MTDSTDSATADLADLLRDVTLATYLLSLRQEVENAGGDASAVQLTNADVAALIEEDAYTTAQGIVATAETDLQNFLDGLPAETAESDLSGLIAEWSAARAEWKNQQIGTTTVALAAALAQRDFVARSGAVGQAWFDGPATCDVCSEVAAGSPYALDDPIAFTVLHPNCQDEWWADYSSVADIWLGG